MNIKFIISEYRGQSINNLLRRAIVYENWWLSLGEGDSVRARSRFITFKQCSGRYHQPTDSMQKQSGSLRHASQCENILLPFHMYPRVDVSFCVMQRKCGTMCIVIPMSYLDWRSRKYGAAKITTSCRTTRDCRDLIFNTVFFPTFIRSYLLFPHDISQDL